MSFVRYTKSTKSYVPKISIWKRGNIGFNRGAITKFNLTDYKYVILFYDEDEKKIGIQLTNDPSEKGIIKIIKTKTGASISAKGFLSTYGLLHDKTINYNVHYDENDKMHVIDLKEKDHAIPTILENPQEAFLAEEVIGHALI
jgi:hypothetical protein